MSAVIEIKKMKMYETPEDKINCIVQTAEIIRESIETYYKFSDFSESLAITPDDLLSLFAYIIIKANVNSLIMELS